MQNKWERWFFGFLLFGTFFIVAVVAGDLLNSIMKIGTEKFNRLEQLAEINVPIYIGHKLGIQIMQIEAMEKCS